MLFSSFVMAESLYFEGEQWHLMAKCREFTVVNVNCLYCPRTSDILERWIRFEAFSWAILRLSIDE